MDENTKEELCKRCGMEVEDELCIGCDLDPESCTCQPKGKRE